MEPDEPEQEEQETEEPDKEQGNAAETGGIGLPNMKEKQRTKKTGETGTTGQPIMREKTGKEQAVKTEPVGHPAMQERRRNKHAVGLGIIELPGIPEEEGDSQTITPGTTELPGMPEEDGTIHVINPGTTGIPGIPVKEAPGPSAETGTGEQPIMLMKEPTGQPPRTVPYVTPGPDNAGPDAPGTPGKPGKKKVSKKKPPASRHGNEVYRKTEMPGMSAKSFPGDPIPIRRRTGRDLKNPGFGIPYAATEKAVRDLVCSLVEREDRIHEGMLLDINCMQQDIGMLKDQVYALKTMKSVAAAGEKK